MKTKTSPFIKAIMMCAAICYMVTVRAQTLTVSDSSSGSCNNNGQITVYVTGGTAPYIYALSSYYSGGGTITQSSPVFTGLSPEYYNVSVTDAAGNGATLFVYIPGTFSAYQNITPAVCPATTGSENIVVDSAQYSYTYLWSNGATTATITNVPIGANYSCTVTKTSTGCSIVLAPDSFGMYQTSSIADSFSNTIANCNNGTSVVTVWGGAPPYTYLWSTNQTTTTATNLSSQQYTVTVTDAQGCTSVGWTYIQQGIVISTNVTSTAENCSNDDGTATITALNGTAPFTYLWSTGNTTATITGLATNGYSVTVIDAAGCTASNYAYVSQTSPIITSATASNTQCTNPTGSVTVTASGGTAPYSYVWTTSPVQITATASGLPAGSYNVVVTDAAGCVQYAYAQVNDNSSLSLNLSTVNAICGVVTGSAFANVSGGNPPYSYIWNTGATTSSISGINQTECVFCTVTDASICLVNQNSTIYSYSPVSLSISTSNASCIYTADGAASVSVSGGTAPYTYYWSNGQTSATATGLLTGWYSVYVSDAHGCSQSTYFNVGYNSILPCAVSISGYVINDYNADCIEDGPDYGLQNVWVGCFPDGGWQWTTYGGSYDFILPPGAYYVEQAPPLYHTVICPSTPPTVTLTAGQSSPNCNFYNQPDSVNDLTLATIPFEPAVAGFTQQIDLFIANLGSINANPDVVYMHSVSENFLGSTPSPSSYDPTTGRIEWNSSILTSLAANGIDMITLNFGIPSSLATGYILNNTDTVYPIVGDYDPNNNYESYIANVVRAYDPNYIDVTPAGTGTPGYISTTKDSLLQYVVHFQNTGNYQATDVKLKIPVDPNLDISTFHFIGSSSTNPPTITADKNRILTIDFPYIYLPDSFASPLGSHGFAAFTFKQVKGLQPLSTIQESANIYFDYNTPVPTNSTLNTIENNSGIRVISQDGFGMYPNPTQDNVTLDLSALNESRVEVRVYDMMGRMTLELPYTNISGTKQLSLSTSGLAAGVYSVEVTGSTSHVQKLVKTDK